MPLKAFQQNRPLLSVVLSLVLAIVVLAVYGQVRHFNFLVWDDFQILVSSHLYNPPSAKTLDEIWSQPQYGLYVPLTSSVWAAIAHLWWQPESVARFYGPILYFPAYPFHVVNLLLHLGNVWLVFALLRHVLSQNASLADNTKTYWIELAAFAGALFFALHPLQVEAVAWVSELKGMLCSFFVLSALFQFLKSLATDSTAKRRWLSALAFVLYVLAFLSKPAAVPAPLLALVLGKLVSADSWRALAARLSLWWGFALVAIFIARFAQPTDVFHYPLWWRPFVAGDALAFYMSKILWPFGFACNYAHSPPVAMQTGWAYVIWLIPALAALAILRRKQTASTTALWLWLLPLLPILGLVPFSFQFYSTVADRYAYLSLLGPALFIAICINNRQSAKLLTIMLLYSAFLGALAYRQTTIWVNSQTLLTHCLQVAPRSWGAKASLGFAASAQGRNSEAISYFVQALGEPTLHPYKCNDYGLALGELKDLKGAEFAFLKALKTDPTYGDAWSNLGTVYTNTKQYDKAIDAYKNALKLIPDSNALYIDLGLAYATSGHVKEALEAFQNALRIKPDDAEALYNLGLAYGNQKDYQAAQEAFIAAVQAKPDYWEARQALGVTYHLQGQTDKAITIWRAILKENPSFDPARQMLLAIEDSVARQKSADTR